MVASVERRRRKKHKYRQLEDIIQSSLYSLLGSDGSRRSRKRSRSSSSSTSRKTSRHKHHKNHSRREERKSRKSHRDIKQEKLDTSYEVIESAAASKRNMEIEVIIIDENTPEETPKNSDSSAADSARIQAQKLPKQINNPEIVAEQTDNSLLVKPKEESSENHENDLRSVEIVSQLEKAAKDANEKLIELSTRCQTENPQNTEESLEIVVNETEQESVATVCSNLVKTWKNILNRGLSSQANGELLKKYRLTEYSEAFKAPTLNQAIKSLLNGAEIVRDDVEIARQNQLGSLISAIEKGVNLIVNCRKRCSGLAKVVETMNDAASFIAQLHYSISLQRRMRVAEQVGIAKMEIVAPVDENLFSEQEEKEIKQRVTELIEFAIIDEEIEKRLAIVQEEEMKKVEEAKKLAEEEAKKLAEEEAKKMAEEKAKKMAEEEAKKMAEEEAKKMADEEAKKMAEEKEAAQSPEEEEEEEEEIPCSQRFNTSRHSGCTLFKTKIEGAKGVKSEGRVKSEKGAYRHFVPNSDFPGLEKATEMVREWQGFPKSAIPIALMELADSTLKQYKPHIQKWWDFSRRESCHTFNPKVSDVMEFFVECQSNNMSLNALKTARSALSYFVKKDLGRNNDLSTIFKVWEKKLKK